ncbi:MAG: CBS domain-containing protein [Thermoanaerobaculia bacterium]|nr:CBS domain-containing protein [Thermoanaerobaculia bacterium]
MSELLVKDLMTTGVLTMSPDDSLRELRDMMHSRHVRHVPIVNARQQIKGLVSHRDLLRNTLFDRPRISQYVEDEILASLQVSEVMTTHVECVGPDQALGEAARIMIDRKFGCLPVISEGKLVGILTESDFVRLHASEA